MMTRFSVPVLAFLFVTVCSAGQVGGWRLADESSPYLQLHAENPVEWYPWGKVALAKARKENKPLFISIGYFTCHWCHVMARESFSDPAIAKILNENFIAIKIDREQRPDLDAAYMEYVQMTQGRGGWPMSVWTTPEGEPFLGGTYYPPESGHGLPGFRELLQHLAQLWQEDEDSMRQTAQRAVESLLAQGRSVEPVKTLSARLLQDARRYYRESYDELQGGFGPAPKFPQPARLMFLLQDAESDSHEMALHTLDRMAAGGIHDQLGGGFHRYSTDFEWRVPHFEKMLYDQALIARAYLYAWRRVRRDDYAEVVRDVLDFSLRELRHAQGGFYSALGADSPVPGAEQEHMEEGVYYTWDWQQLGAVLEGDLFDWAVARYGLTQQGNASGASGDEMDGKNVLLRKLDNQQLMQQFKVDLLTANHRNATVEQALMAGRKTRPPVPVDDKIVAAWNGYMMTTLAMAGRLLDEPRYIKAAEQVASFVLDQQYDVKRGVLYRDWRDGVRGVPAFNEDYAGIAEGLLMLYKVTGDKQRLQQAMRLADTQLKLFYDDVHGGFFNTSASGDDWLREKRLVDGASVSDNSASIHVLLALGKLTGRKDYVERARQTAAWASAQLARAPSAMPYALLVWPELLSTAGTKPRQAAE